MKGKAILNETAGITNQLKAGVYTQDEMADQPSGGRVTAVFPRSGLGTESKRDELMRAKAELVAQAPPGTTRTPFGTVQLSDQDIQWILQKRKTEAEANFDSWVGTNFHTHDVTGRKWLQEVMPEFYEKREKEMIDKAKIALRINRILLRGPKSEKDLLLIWGLQTGQIQLDRNWNVIGPNKTPDDVDMEEERERFVNGLLTPKRYWSDSERLLNSDGFVPGGKQTWNPFQPQNNDNRNGQVPYPFYGGVVPDQARYPTFLRDAIEASLNN